MKKYYLIFKNSLQSGLAYRMNTFAYFFSEAFSLLVMIYLWLSIYSQGNKIGSYTFRGLIIYYILTNLISLSLNAQDIARIIGEEIRLGEFVNYLLKPINFQLDKFFYNLGAIAYNFSVYFIIFFIAFVLFFNLTDLNYLLVFYFLIFTIMAVVINFLIYYIIGISTFYLGFIMGVNFIISNIIFFLSGNLVPLDLLPSAVLKIVNWLPFKYLAFIPISIITGRIATGNLLSLFVGGLLWIAILYLISLIIYKQGLKKYEAFGS